MNEETIQEISPQGQDDTDTERWVTWQRTIEMVGRIRRKPGITWEQIEGALSGQTGYVCTPLKRVYDDEHQVIATIYGCDAVDAEDEGFTLGNTDE